MADDDEDQDRLWMTSKNPLQLEDPAGIHVSLVGLLQICMLSQSLKRRSRLHIGKTGISSESKIWKVVIIEEMNSLHKNDTWELSKLPKGKKMIGYKWVFAKKIRISR